MFLVGRIFAAYFLELFPVSRCNKNAKYSTLIICFSCLFPSVRTVDFDAKILFEGLIKAFLSIACVKASSAASSLA